MSCDNASNNDSMIAELSKLVPKFSGAKNHTRCFLHILVKSILKQFDAPKTQTARLDDSLLEMARDLDNEELQAQSITKDEDDVEDDVEDDNTEGWIDERELMTVSEKEKLEKSVAPLRLMLTKVCEIKLELEFSYKNCIATENGLRYKKFINDFTAEVVLHT